MKTFDVTPGLSRDFEVLYNGLVIGRSVGRGIFSSRADIIVSGKVYGLQPKNFWRTRYELIANGRPVIEIQHRWRGSVRFSLPGKALPYYELKRRGLFYSGFTLNDNKGAELLLVSTIFKLFNFQVKYEVLAKDIFATTDTEMLLLFLSVYYFRRQRRKRKKR